MQEFNAYEAWASERASVVRADAIPLALEFWGAVKRCARRCFELQMNTQSIETMYASIYVGGSRAYQGMS